MPVGKGSIARAVNALQTVKEAETENITAGIMRSISKTEADTVFPNFDKKVEAERENIHEMKFNFVTTASKDMPFYLL